MNIEPHSEKSFPEPFATALGPYVGRRVSAHFGLTHLSAHLEVLPPNSQSALRHWHTHSDELLMVLEGELTLVDDEGATTLGAGMCAGFRAGDENAHHLINRSDQDATYFVVGSKPLHDVVHYPDDDIRWSQDDAGDWQALHKDGTPY